MLLQSIQPATYNDILKNIKFVRDISSITNFQKGLIYPLSICCIIIIVILIYAFIKSKISNNYAKHIYSIISFIIIIVASIFVCIFLNNHHKRTLAHYELQNRDAHYRTITLKGNVDDISNGSQSETQEIRFSNNNKNYYVTIASNIPVTTSDSITVKLNKQLVDNSMNLNNLSESINDNNNNKVIIKHNDINNKTNLIRTDNYTDISLSDDINEFLIK